MNCRSTLLVVASVGLVAPSALAQLVWPAAYATAPGNAVMNAPFSAYTGQPTGATRCMVIIDPSSLPFPVGTVLTRLSLRRDRTYASQGYGAFTGSLSVRLGRAIVAPDGVQDVRFGRLWDGNATQVFNAAGSSFVLPVAPAPGAGLPPFNVVIPFTTNFTWQGGPLAVDLLWTPSSGSSVWRLDAFATPRGNGTFRTLGPGCAGSNGFTPFHYALPETTLPGSMLTLQMEGAVRPPTPGTLQDVSLHLIGLSGTTYMGLPLPLNLATVLGMPAGCFLRTDVLLSTLVPVTNSSALFGRSQVQIALPSTPAFAGAQLYSQWLLFDLGVNAPFQATVSDGIEITLGQVPPPAAPRRARTLWKYGATGFDIDSGRMAADEYAPVMRFN